MKTALRLLLIAAGSMLLPSVFAGPIEPPNGIRHYETGTAPGFVLGNMDGERFDLASARGKWVFLHFWASWCGPCREEMPAIQQMSDQFADDELAVILVNTAENEDTIFSFLAEINMGMSSLMDADGQVTEQYRPRGLPTTILIDRNGQMQYQAIGGREWQEAEYTGFLRELISKH